MHLVSHAAWSLVQAMAYLGAAMAHAADGVLDIGMVFPYPNETYAPMERFPIVFALQNAKLAQHLQPLIQLTVLNGSMTMLDEINRRTFDLESGNYTTKPYLLYAFMDFKIEGPLRFLLQVSWRTCDESGDEVSISRNNGGKIWIDLDMKEGAQKADLVASTAAASEEKCPTDVGVTITVTDKTYYVAEPSSDINKLYGTCAVVATPSPTPTSNPCRVKLDEATVESMEANEQARRCQRLNPPHDCPKDGQAIHKSAVAGGVIIAAALGAAGFLIA